MLSKWLAAVVASGIALALSCTPANAAATAGSFGNFAGPKACLDYRSDYGVYVTTCNYGYYQEWYYDPEVPKTALRQRATGLCLTVRSGQPAMRSCSASDPAAFWHVESSTTLAIRNDYYPFSCLGRMKNDRVNLPSCSGGDSQRWYPWP
ncbi:ricin-type beta-trefoil lectin domain protein [Streptomyces sp. NPDC048514]|uniref:RICIN domain-containing protein n=1 Tax=Streptomyces sp. NPDC048514 TaxID=3365564 RepID=UPI00371FA267